jgi:hypothetical protein
MCASARGVFGYASRSWMLSLQRASPVRSPPEAIRGARSAKAISAVAAAVKRQDRDALDRAITSLVEVAHEVPS